MRMSPSDTASPLSIDDGRMRARVSLTPLIDVVFILLVFFMLASSFLDWQAFDLSVVTPGPDAESSEQQPMRIVLSADGTWLLEGKPVRPVALRARVEAALRSDPARAFYVEPQAGVSLQTAVDALDYLRASGAERVSLIRGGRPR